MSDRVLTNSPAVTHGLLVRDLRRVTEWDELGINLGLEESEIAEIENDYHRSSRRRIAMLAKWLKKEKNEKVIEALESMEELSLADQLRERHILKYVSPVQSHSEVLLAVHSSDPIRRKIEDLMSEYLRLVVMVESAVAEVNPPRIKIKRFSEYYELPTAYSVEQLFDRLRPFYLLEFAMLKNIADFFLKDSSGHKLRPAKINPSECTPHSEILKCLHEYVVDLDEFNSCTTVQQFMKNITETAQHLSADKDQVCNVSISLVGSWLTKTMEELENVVKALLTKRLCLLHLIKVKRLDSIVRVDFCIPKGSGVNYSFISTDKPFLDSQGVLAVEYTANSDRVDQETPSSQNKNSRDQNPDHDSHPGDKEYSAANEASRSTGKSSGCSSTTANTTSSGFTADNSASMDNGLVLALLAMWAMLFKRMISVFLPTPFWLQVTYGFCFVKVDSAYTAPVEVIRSKIMSIKSPKLSSAIGTKNIAW